MTPSVTRRKMLALTALAARSGLAGPRGQGSMLLDSFMRELDAADRSRREALAAIGTRDQVTALRNKVHRVMTAGIGAFPERTPLNAVQVGELSRDGYVIEKLLFESRPEYYVSANLYRPKSTAGRRPAVVQSCGHYEEGKATPDYQLACAALALKGFVALIFDPMGQGERLMYRLPGEKKSPATSEHTIAGRPTLLLGRTLANYRIWDAMRALDYLETRPEVDPERLGMLGHSGGGMTTLLTAPLEPRIRAAMSCCAVTSFYHKTRALMNPDPEQIVPGVYANGVDHPEMIAAAAPRAFLIGAVLKDNVPLEGTRRTFDETRPVYELLGKAENFDKVESDNIHKLDKNLREGCYRWMLKHLAGEAGNWREPELRVEATEDLWCTKTGSVMALKKARSVFDLNRDRSRQLHDHRAAVRPGAVRALLAPKPEPAVELPVTLARGGGHAAVLMAVVSELGRKSAGALELAAALGDAGYSVLGVDLRGWGETKPDAPQPKQRIQWEDFLAWRAVEMGRPLLGMRVADLLEAIGRVRREFGKIYAVGLEAGGLVALHAAVLENSLAGVATVRTLGSYEDVMSRQRPEEPVSSLVWGALTTYDLPDLAKSIEPRPYVQVDPFDAMRRPLSGAGPKSARAAAREILDGLRL